VSRKADGDESGNRPPNLFEMLLTFLALRIVLALILYFAA
jgi:hypothetical protein